MYRVRDKEAGASEDKEREGGRSGTWRLIGESGSGSGSGSLKSDSGSK